VQAYQWSPPPALLSPAPAKRAPEVARPPLWERLPAENRRRLSQIVARVIARHPLPLQKEGSDD
jgi:hypothetical protein